MVSDRESKAHTAIESDKVYGESVQIKKEESINHVAKRVGKALRNFAQIKSKKGECWREKARKSYPRYHRETARLLSMCNCKQQTK